MEAGLIMSNNYLHSIVQWFSNFLAMWPMFRMASMGTHQKDVIYLEFMSWLESVVINLSFKPKPWSVRGPNTLCPCVVTVHSSEFIHSSWEVKLEHKVGSLQPSSHPTFTTPTISIYLVQGIISIFSVAANWVPTQPTSNWFITPKVHSDPQSEKHSYSGRMG